MRFLCGVLNIDAEFIKHVANVDKTNVTTFLDNAGLIAVEDKNGRREYTLKPLAELFGNGHPGKSVDPESDAYLALFLEIERGWTWSVGGRFPPASV